MEKGTCVSSHPLSTYNSITYEGKIGNRFRICGKATRMDMRGLCLLEGHNAEWKRRKRKLNSFKINTVRGKT